MFRRLFGDVVSALFILPHVLLFSQHSESLIFLILIKVKLKYYHFIHWLIILLETKNQQLKISVMYHRK